MKRKTKPLITGGLLGLAGLGLLPQGAEANSGLPVAVPDPTLGATLAEDPRPVVVPEPSTQTTAPQTEEQGAAQPTWTPESDSPIAAAAAAAAESTPAPSLEPEPTAVDLAEPESSAQADLAAPEVAAALPVPAPATIASVAEPALSPEPLESGATEPSTDRSQVEEAAIPQDAVPQSVDPQSAVSQSAIGAIASPPEAVAATTREPAAPEAFATPTPAEPLAAVAPKPAAAKPVARAAQLPEIAPAAVSANRVNDEDGQSDAIAIAPAPSPAATPAPTARPSSRRPAPDVATLRSRAATVQTLLHNLRSAYGIEDPLTATDATAAPAAPLRQVSRPETLQRGPQLPPLPSRSARRSSTAAQRVAAADPAPVASAAQLPSSPGPTPNVALALPNPQPVMSSGRAADLSPESVDVPLAEAAVVPRLAASPSTVTTAQATPSTTEADQVRDDLRIEPLTTAAEPARSFPPSPNAGIPSAFGADWGDIFFSASLSGADRLRAEADGSLSMGFGLGDARQAVGVELAYNLQSIRRFGENGGFDAKVHRQVYGSDNTQVAAAVGVNNFVSYGADTAGTSASVYGVVTAAHLLQPENPVNRMPITATLGAGSGYFSGDNSDVGVIAGVGLQVHPQFSINTAWSGVGVNVGASIVPEPTIPLTLNLLYGDVGNNTRAGSVAVLSIGYGFNFGPRF
ncbi:hypothetical protein C7293_10530 [filamentous cyanobacterium CCT1]|nr:hypothetical protein C7293_10530 [filamentous cyanobacterium CCT1]